MKNIFLDANVLLDISLYRHPFITYSDAILSMILDNRYNGFVSAASIPTIYYVISKEFGKNKALHDIRIYTTYLNIVATNDKIINLSLDSGFNDFEDAIQYFSALSCKSDIIISRNKKDYSNSKLPVFSPEEFVNLPQ